MVAAFGTGNGSFPQGEENLQDFLEKLLRPWSKACLLTLLTAAGARVQRGFSYNRNNSPYHGIWTLF